MRTSSLAVLALLACPAFAAPLYVAPVADGSSITLTDEAGPCLGRARLAIWTSRDARDAVRGCYLPPVADAEAIMVLFLDGEVARIPLAALRKPVML